MLWHFLELILRPGGDGVNVAVIVTHEVEIRQRHSDRFRANPEEAANINNRSAVGADAVKVIHRSDLVIVCAVNRRALEVCWYQFRRI